MADYSIEIKTSVEKDLETLPDDLLARIFPKIEALSQLPRPAGCQKLRGYKDQWRIRVGDWRVVYIIDDSSSHITITRVAHRREVYKN